MVQQMYHKKALECENSDHVFQNNSVLCLCPYLIINDSEN